jgi:hypothetical protein
VAAVPITSQTRILKKLIYVYKIFIGKTEGNTSFGKNYI